jgi:peptidoglycan/xylan/chitin deacetylase (PgdA/CDA1 family)
MTAEARLKGVVAYWLLQSGVMSLRRPHFEKNRALLLVYHRVNDANDPYFPALPRKVFAAQLDYLVGRYLVQSYDDVVAWLAEGAEGPPRVAITIDDGYPDTLEVVLPELTRRGLPATLFLSTAPPETGQPLWTDRTRWIVKHARAPLGDEAQRLRTLAEILGRFKALGPAAVDQGVEDLEAELRPEGPPLGLLSWDDVRRLQQGQVSLGAHTHRHYMVSRLDDSTLAEEIGRSVRLIEERVGVAVRSFAYPNGRPEDYDARAIDVLRELGLRSAATCRHGLARPTDDPFQLPRLYTREPSLPLFAARLAGFGREERPEGNVS